MSNSILFLGRFDDNLLFLEANIISFGKNVNENKNILTKKKDLLQTPDVIKYQIDRYNYDAWIIIGDVKPTLLLKKLISEVQIILFVFNTENSETLDFLNEGWGPIFDRSKPEISKTQQRFLIGTCRQTISKHNDGQKSKIQKAMKKFCCINYFEENISNFKNKSQNNHSNLFKTLQKQFSNDKQIQRNDHNLKKRSKEVDVNDSNLIDEKSKIIQKNDSNNNDSIEDNDDDITDKNSVNNSSNDNDNFTEEFNESNSDDDVFDENEIIDDEKITFIDVNSVEYNLYKKSKIAEVAYSPKSKGDIMIPTFIKYESIQYTIRRVCDAAFSNSKIESLSFSYDSRVKVFGNSVFENSQIKELSIPSSLTKFNDYWCKGADNLTKINVDEKSKFFSIDKNFLIRIDRDNKKKIISKKIIFSPRTLTENIFIPEDITHIESYAFSNLHKLYSLNSESSILTVINSFSFFGCEYLKNINLKKAYKLTLGDFCFSNAVNLQSVEIECEDVTIGENCFSNCPLLSLIKFQKAKKITVCSQSFNDCPKLDKIMADDVNKLVVIIKKNENIESTKKNFDLFESCSSITSLVIKGESNIDILSYSILQIQCKNIKIKSNSQLTIKQFFSFKSKIEKIKLIGNKLNVDYGCFKNYNTLDSLIIKSEENIIFDKKDYLDYKSLKNLFLNTKKDIYLQNKFLHDDINLESINLNAQKINICTKCFENLQYIKCLTINGDNVEIYSDAFKNCTKLKKIVIKSKSQLLIHNHCFAFCKNLNTIIFNSADLLLHNYCFFNCSSLSLLDFCDFDRVSISDNVFEGCIQLEKVKIKADRIVYAGKSCFKNLDKLTMVKISSKIITIDEFCFSECKLISELKIEKAKEILFEKNAFYKCSNIRDINITAELQFNLGFSCFSNAINLTSVSLAGNKITVNNNCFDNCSSLNSFIVENSKEVSLGDRAFICCKKLENMCIRDAFSFRAGASCFEKDETLSDVTIESKNIFLDEKCFKKCKKLNQIDCNMAENIDYIKNAFTGVYLKNINQNTKINVFDSKKKYLKAHNSS